ncbi:LysR family transcriptional regulator [Microbacterium horticulturae]|uniref:LysR family transcriptional regulator n=1 Tax=Microbacterium horticulturae TaxID=3028316 RepID=A0ABY8BWG7_9MICO|nr:LysR family transcriptional regulator [Microbacterium sp. KACC 23027]WEG08509.1 LysR family transcriptional regulator [Microbacterium sp. KACC 23027]
MTDVRKLDLNLVVVLDALLDERNLTRAAELVGMTQPAVSGALSRLRGLLDDPLLVREGRGFALTPFAESLLPAVSECMAEVHRMFEVLPEFDPANSTRTFLLAASDYVLSELTSPLLSILERDAPHTNIEFDGLPTEDVVSPIDLLRRDITIAAAGRGVPGKRTSLFSDRFVCIVDAANPALRDGALSLSALHGLRHVRSVFGAHASTQIDDMLSAAEITPRVAVTVQGFMQVPFTVTGTPWVGWVPERTARRYAERLGLTIARTEIAPSVLVEAAHWHPSKSGDPALTWLVAQLRAASELVEFGADT